jgi:hypothetical protein
MGVGVFFVWSFCFVFFFFFFPLTSPRSDATPRMSASDEPGLSTEPTRASIKSARKAAIKSRNAELAK